jgi:hypothetical protein
MCFSLTSALQSGLHRHCIDVVHRDQPQSRRHAPPPHLSNAKRAFHQEFDVTQHRYNPCTGAFERVPERRRTQIVPPRKQKRASWFSSANRDRRGSRGMGMYPPTRRPSQNPRRCDYHAEDVEEFRRYREEQARRNARQNQSHRHSHAQQYQCHPHRRTSVTCSSYSSSYEDINIETRSPHTRPSTSHGYRSPSPSPHSSYDSHSPPFPSQGYEHEHEQNATDADSAENTARSRRSIRFASFDETSSGRTYDGADVLERTPRGGR